MRILITDILVIGAGPAGTYFAYKYLKSINDLNVTILEKKVNPRFPIICGELIPSREVLKRHIPSNIYKYLLETLNETLSSDVVVNKINFVKIFINNNYIGLLPFKTYLIDKGRVLEKLIESIENYGCKVQFNTIVTDCLSKNDMFKLKVFSKEGEEIVKSKIVIGADAYPSVIDISLNMNVRLNDNELIIATSCRARSVEKYDSDVAIVLLSYDLCPGGFAWIFPRNDKVFNVGLGIRASKVSNHSDVLSRHLKLLEKFNLKPLHRPLVKTIPVSGLLDRLSLHNAYLTGDAAGSVIPTNGAGINPAMITSQILVEALNEKINYEELISRNLRPFFNLMRRNRLIIDKILMNKELLNTLTRRFRRFLRKGIEYGLLSSCTLPSDILYGLARFIIKFLKY